MLVVTLFVLLELTMLCRLANVINTIFAPRPSFLLYGATTAPAPAGREDESPFHHIPVHYWTAEQLFVVLARQEEDNWAWGRDVAALAANNTRLRQLTATEFLKVTDTDSALHRLDLDDVAVAERLAEMARQWRKRILRNPHSFEEYREVNKKSVALTLVGSFFAPRATLLWLFVFEYEDMLEPLLGGHVAASAATSILHFLAWAFFSRFLFIAKTIRFTELHFLLSSAYHVGQITAIISDVIEYHDFLTTSQFYNRFWDHYRSRQHLVANATTSILTFIFLSVGSLLNPFLPSVCYDLLFFAFILSLPYLAAARLRKLLAISSLLVQRTAVFAVAATSLFVANTVTILVAVELFKHYISAPPITSWLESLLLLLVVLASAALPLLDRHAAPDDRILQEGLLPIALRAVVVVVWVRMYLGFHALGDALVSFNPNLRWISHAGLLGDDDGYVGIAYIIFVLSLYVLGALSLHYLLAVYAATTVFPSLFKQLFIILTLPWKALWHTLPPVCISCSLSVSSLSSTFSLTDSLQCDAPLASFSLLHFLPSPPSPLPSSLPPSPPSPPSLPLDATTAPRDLRVFVNHPLLLDLSLLFYSLVVAVAFLFRSRIRKLWHPVRAAVTVVEDTLLRGWAGWHVMVDRALLFSFYARSSSSTFFRRDLDDDNDDVDDDTRPRDEVLSANTFIHMWREAISSADLGSDTSIASSSSSPSFSSSSSSSSSSATFSSSSSSSATHYGTSSLAASLSAAAAAAAAAAGNIEGAEGAAAAVGEGAEVRRSSIGSISSLPVNEKQRQLRSNIEAKAKSRPFVGRMPDIVVDRRGDVAAAAKAVIMRASSSELQKGNFVVKFQGEHGVDFLGLTKEFFTIIGQSLIQSASSSSSSSSLSCFEVLPDGTLMLRHSEERQWQTFQFAGRLLGMSVLCGVPMGVSLTRGLLRLMVGDDLRAADVEAVDPLVYKNRIKMLLEKDGVQRTCDALDEKFIYFVDEENEELCVGGRLRLVRENNKEEYARLLCEHLFCGKVRTELHHFITGFWEVLPREEIRALRMRHAELGLLISGVSTIDVADWKSHTFYGGVIGTGVAGLPDHLSNNNNNSNSNNNATAPTPTPWRLLRSVLSLSGDTNNNNNNNNNSNNNKSNLVGWFWQYVEALDNQQRGVLLQFITGSSRLPPRGFADLSPPFTIDLDPNPDHLPSSSTCSNCLHLPCYTSYPLLAKKFALALMFGRDQFGVT